MESQTTAIKNKFNWEARISGWGTLHLWQCTEEDARETADGKADWEGSSYRLTKMTEKDVQEYEGTAYVDWGCYGVGEKR